MHIWIQADGERIGMGTWELAARVGSIMEASPMQSTSRRTRHIRTAVDDVGSIICLAELARPTLSCALKSSFPAPLFAVPQLLFGLRPLARSSALHLLRQAAAMAFGKLAVGHTHEATSPNVLKAAFAEFIAVFLFVFIGVGSVISYNKLHEGDLDATGLILFALSHGFALFITVAATANISGGHVNPAVTFALAIVGKITVLTGLVYWVAQLLGSVLAALLLSWVLPKSIIPVHTLGLGTTWYAGVILEVVLTFTLVFVIFATAVDPANKTPIAPLAIGLVVAAVVPLGGPFTGPSLNPARSFGPALVAWDFTDHWIYWVGPLVGAALAGVAYEELFIAPEPHRHAPVSTDYS